MKTLDEINSPFYLPWLAHSLHLGFTSPLFKDNYLATLVFTGKDNLPGRALYSRYKRAFSRNQRFTKLLPQDPAQISLLPGSVPSLPSGISLFKPPSIRALNTLLSCHWLACFTGNGVSPRQVFLLQTQAWASALPPEEGGKKKRLKPNGNSNT